MGSGPVEDTVRGDEARLWSIELSDSPVIATAIHDGHLVRPALAPLMSLPAGERLREEDPFTGEMSAGVASHIIVHHSRFETDLNRARSGCVYTSPEQCWGLDVWNGPLPAEEEERSRSFHDDYYAMLETVLRRMEKRYGTFIVLDLHSYNHRRSGPDAPPTPQADAPDINIGTHSMDRDRWDGVIHALMSHFSSTRIGGRFLDVRENVAFQGKGEQTRFIHERFPETGCAVAIEFKKFFMDEWTGEPDRRAVEELTALMRTAVPLLETLAGGS